MELVLRNGKSVRAQRGFAKWMGEMLGKWESELYSLWGESYVDARVLQRAVNAIREAQKDLERMGEHDAKRARDKARGRKA